MSSSAHIALVPQLAGWPYARADPELRKAFETALHLGSAAGFAGATTRTLPLSAHALVLAPVVAAGLGFERPIERRLGSARSVAVAQLIAGAMLLAADHRPARRRVSDLRLADAAMLGLAQASALAPGVSRSGALLTAARALAYDRASAEAIARETALPVLVGAAALKGLRLARKPPPRSARAALVVGAASAFASTLAARPLTPAGRSVTPFALYRIALGAAALRSTRRSQRAAPAARNG